MKTKILLLFIAVGLTFTSCKKDEDDLSVNAKLTGKWKNTASHTDYYNTSGVKLFTEISGPDDLFNYEFDGKSMLKVSNTNGPVIVTIPTIYSVSTINGVDYVNITFLSETDKSAITTLTTTNLTLKSETTEDVYYVENEQDKPAAKAVSTQEFTKM